MSIVRLDETHDPALTSWVEGADAESTDFPIQNLPYGRFRREGCDEPWRIGVAIGEHVLDTRRAATAVVWPADTHSALNALADGDLNAFMAMPGHQRRSLRLALSRMLRTGYPDERALRPCLVSHAAAEFSLPCRIGNYTDFYTGVHHATAVGRLFRPDAPLLPNYRWVPIGYHGRSSSIVVSGTPVRRPLGQARAPGAQEPTFGPSERLDYELELALYVGAGNALGQPIAMTDAEEHVFGIGLLNDWSARDIQAWEYQPLGPFLSKNFASSVSPWIITMEALQPFRAEFKRAAEHPQPLPYLDGPDNRAHGAIDVVVEAWLQTAAMRARGLPSQRMSQANFRDAYWTPAQLVTHHTVNGCNLQSGDLLGSGTLSGPDARQGGTLLELSAGGTRPVDLAGGESRCFLQDGDTVTLHAYCDREGARRIGFGVCTGTVLPV